MENNPLGGCGTSIIKFVMYFSIGILKGFPSTTTF